MILYAAGVNHRTAPVELRERLHLSPDEIAGALMELKSEMFSEACMLSTCNRTELYAIPAKADAGGDDLISALRLLRPDARLDERHFFRLFSCGAVRHLFRVAAALDSQVLGDMQILGQVKGAFEIASAAGAMGNIMRHLSNSALRTGKRVRAETEIGIGAVSISFAAVELTRRIFADLGRKQALLIGAGETGALAARHLRDKGVGGLTLTNRTHARALELAGELNARVVPFEVFADALQDVDIVISATASPTVVVEYEMVRRAMKHRQNRPLLLIDIALPRDIDRRASELSGVFLHDLDTLQNIVDQNVEKRKQEIPRAEVIVTEEVVNFFLWFNTLEATPTIQQLRGKFEAIRAAELEKFRNRIGAADLDNVDLLTRRIINKLLHPTMVGIKQSAEDASALSARLQVLRQLFDLDDAEYSDS